MDLTPVRIPLPAEEQYSAGQPLRACFLPAAERFTDSTIDMGTGFDCFRELSHPGNLRMGLQQRIRRFLLKTLMDKHDFKNCD